jgi:hypothetical protein
MVFEKWKQFNKKKIKSKPVFLLFFVVLALVAPSSVKADLGLLNGKLFSGETDNYLMWLQTRDSSYNYTDRFFIDKVGNVGINTTAPAVKLDIDGGINQVMDVSGGRIMGLNLIPTADSEAVPRKYLHDNFAPTTGGVGSAFVQGGNSFGTTAILGTNDNYDLSFISNGTNRMTIDSSGNVGIGTTSPSKLLDISDSQNTTLRLTSTKNANDWVVGDVGSQIEFYGKDMSSGQLGVRGFIQSINEDDSYGHNWGLAFGTTHDNQPPTEALRIDQDGNVGIGTTGPGERLSVSPVSSKSIDAMTGRIENVGTPINFTDAVTMSYVESATVLPDTSKYYLKNDDYDSFINIDDNMTTEEIKEAIGMDDSTGLTKVDDPTAPAPGAFEVSGYHAVGPDGGTPYWKVDQDSEYIFETWIKVMSSTADPQRFYAGWEMYDSNKTSFGNVQRYWASVGTQYDSNSYNDGEWHHVVGRISGVGTSYGNFIDGTEYARLVLLLNYSTGDTVTRYAGMKLYKSAKTFTSIYATSGQRTVDSSNLVMDYDGNLFPYNVTASGNVAIGTTSTTVKLDIDGGIGQVMDVSGGRIMGLNLIPTADSEAVPRKYLHDNFAPTTGGVGSAFVQGGNSFGTTAILGTNELQDLAFETNTATRMTIDTDGNIGIGTTSPSYPLTVGYNSGSYQLTLQRSDGAETGMFYVDSGSNLNLEATSGGADIKFRLNEAGVGIQERMTILGENGNVGIGTTSPGAKLDIQGSSNALKLLKSGEFDVTGGYAGSGIAFLLKGKATTDLGLGAGDSEIMRLTTGGNVGIGTTSPSGELHVYDATGVSRLRVESGVDSNANIQIGNNVSLFEQYVDSDGKFHFYKSPNNLMTIQSNGNVGIGTTGPGARLDVQADATYSIYAGNKRIGNVAEPVLDTDVATRQYVDGLFEGGTEITGDLNMGGFDILGVNKLTVNTIDPLYRIDNVLYSSYAPSMVGGVKEEYVGKTKIDKYNSSIGQYEHIIDFDKVKPGSDLWLWRKVIDYSEDKVEVLLTPYGDFANLYYKLEGNKIIFRSDKRVEASYRLVANRFDWKKWPTLADDQEEKGGLFIE